MRQGQDGPPAAFSRPLTSNMRGWAHSYRPWGSPAPLSRLAQLTWVKRRRWADRRHPHTSATWIHHWDWRRRDAREVCATPVTPTGQVWLTTQKEIPSLFHAKVTGNRRPYDGDGVYGRRRRGDSPTGQPRGATLLQPQHGRCAYCGLYCQQEDPREVAHRHGDRRNARSNNLQALQGQCQDAQTREHEAYLPVGRRDKHQHTEERRDRQHSCAVLKQREAEGSAYRLEQKPT